MIARLSATIFVGWFVLSAAGCASNRYVDHDDLDWTPRSVEHVVIFWLKDPGNLDQRGRIVTATYGFRSIPGVLSAEAGQMLPSPRGNVDKTYDVAAVIRLRDEAALEAYQAHPRHKAMLQELGPFVMRVIAYDFKYADPAHNKEGHARPHVP